jgi:FMN phosphatase YigB (HAD superfamily)
MAGSRTVLLDVGGVLTPDPWETLILTRHRGIGARLGLDAELMERAARELWPVVSRAVLEESEYWRRFGQITGHAIPPALVEEVELELLRANSDAKQAIGMLREWGVAWGIISDNTSFWYPKQLRLLGLNDEVDPGLEFLSFRHGLSKSSNGLGLYEIAAQSIDPGSTVVIDDRAANLKRAQSLGFTARYYGFDPGRPDHGLSQLLRETLKSEP